MNITTIEEALQRASFCLEKVGLDQPRFDAEVLMTALLGIDRLQMILKRNQQLTSNQKKQYLLAVRRRCKGEPSAYITGQKYFYSYRFNVSKSVLIPRPESELLIDRALHWYKTQKEVSPETINCIDLGTGSGVLAVTLALEIENINIWAVDISRAALEQAAQNALMHGVRDRITLCQGDYIDAFVHTRPKPHADLILSNPPYINSADLESLPESIRTYEPLEALDGGEDGLNAYRAIVKGLPGIAKKRALILFEIGADQKEQVETICRDSGLFQSIKCYQDLAGHPRVIEGKM